jgi:hypothetical protein
MPSSLKKRAAIMALLLVLALGLYLLLRPAQAPGRAPGAGATPGSATATAVATGAASVPWGPWELLARATQQAEAAYQAAPVLAGDDDESLRRFETQWCAGPGAVVAASLRQGASELPRSMGKDDDKALNQLGDALLRRAQASLRQRGDTRSWALADWLALDDAAQGQAARQRLLTTARSSQDGLVISLARNKACADTLCRQELAARWASLEPGNLQALIAAEAGPLTDEQLQRWAASSSSNDYRTELFDLVNQVEAPLRGALLRGSLGLALIGRSAAWTIPDYRELIRVCRSRPLPAERAASCAAIAERLWSADGGQLIDSGVALGLIAAQPDLRTAWSARAQRHEASMMWLTRGQGLTDHIQLLLRHLACADGPDDDRRLRSLLGNERERLLQEMLAADADIAALSAQYRQTHQRGALEPTPSR